MESLKDLITTIEDTMRENRNKSAIAYNKLSKPGTASKRKGAVPFTKKTVEQIEGMPKGESGPAE